MSKYTESLFEAKLIFLGQGDVGKTSLMKKMIDPDFEVIEGKEKTTHGINIQKWNLKLPVFYDDYGFYYSNRYFLDSEIDFVQDEESSNVNAYKNAIINIWDFGGQEIYHSTHQFFLTKRSIYVFVWDPRKEEEYKSFEYWFNIIKKLGENSPLIIVMNKADIRIKAIDENSLKKEFGNIKGFHRVSCISGNGLPGFYNTVERVFRRLPHIGHRLPKVWINIKNDLQAYKEDYISYHDYLEICRHFSLTQKQADYLSDYYHDLGYFLHYRNDPTLKNIIILNPKWATNAFYSLIDDLEIQKKLGRFSFSDLDRIWNRKYYPSEKYFEVIRLMERFEICFNLIGTQEYIIPTLLQIELKTNLDTNKFIASSELRFEYRFEFMPAGVIPRFICRVFYHIKKESFGQNGALLEFEDSTALIISDPLRKKIKVYVIGEEKVEALGIVRNEFNKIFESLKLIRDGDYIEMVPCICSECIKIDAPHFYEFKILKHFKSRGKNSITCNLSVEEIEISALLSGYGKVKIREKLIHKIIVACSHLQGMHKIVSNNEDSRNNFIAVAISNMGTVSKDQSRWGISPTKKSQGELDVRFEDKSGLPMGVFEGLNLSNLDTTKIQSHYKKIFGYDPNGLKYNYLVIYSDAINFLDLWSKYQKAIMNTDLEYPFESEFEDFSNDYSYGSGIKVGKTIHKRDNQNSIIYHIFLNMNPAKELSK